MSVFQRAWNRLQEAFNEINAELEENPGKALDRAITEVDSWSGSASNYA